MGIFGKDSKKKQKNPNERNLIGDRQVTANLANTALGMLAQGEDYEDLAGTKCEFGYLFEIEDHGLEALFKIITDKTTAYFAAQKTSLMRLNFTEELFRSTTETFLELHQG
ncbi:MAG: hypothetical protein HFF11_09955 [Angelakisella sp.]|jgi:hypothetical protein|nr:hypothetical protein [Angelakisella sp.]